VGAGLIRGEQHQIYVEQLDRMVDTHKAVVLDVRDPEEYNAGAIKGAINIPLGELRSRIDELAADRPIITYCRQGR
jgi:rhodanese-related sulfurtransferase